MAIAKSNWLWPRQVKSRTPRYTRSGCRVQCDHKCGALARELCVSADSLLRLASRGMSDRGPLLLFHPLIGAICSLAWVRCVVVETRITVVTSSLCGSVAATNVDPRRSPSAEGGKMRHFCWGGSALRSSLIRTPSSAHWLTSRRTVTTCACWKGGCWLKAWVLGVSRGGVVRGPPRECRSISAPRVCGSESSFLLGCWSGVSPPNHVSDSRWQARWSPRFHVDGPGLVARVVDPTKG